MLPHFIFKQPQKVGILIFILKLMKLSLREVKNLPRSHIQRDRTKIQSGAFLSYTGTGQLKSQSILTGAGHTDVPVEPSCQSHSETAKCPWSQHLKDCLLGSY